MSAPDRSQRAAAGGESDEGELGESPPGLGTIPRRGNAPGRSRPREEEEEEGPPAKYQAVAIGEPPKASGSSPSEIIRGLHLSGSPPARGSAAERRAVEGGRRGTRLGAPRTPLIAAAIAQQLDYVRSRDENQVKIGTLGEPVKLYANYYNVIRAKNWCLNQYSVAFSPDIDHIGTRKALLREHQNVLPAYTFDGASLHTNTLIADAVCELVSTLRPRRDAAETSGEPQCETQVQIKLQFVAQLDETDGMVLHFYSIMTRKCLGHLKLALLGRNFFDPNLAIQLPNHRLQIWPGFLTTMRVHDVGLLYGVQTLHKVIRTDTVWSMMQTKRQEVQGRGGDMERVKQAVREDLLGIIVITLYNKRTYRVDDISWNEKPSSTFPKKDGTQISYMDYYQTKHDIKIQTPNQPLLVSNPSKKDMHRGQTEPVKLIPELCYMTGLSESMRQNFNLMREMVQHLFQTPDRKVQTNTNFMERVQTNPEVQEELTKWGLSIQDNMVKVLGRKMRTEEVHFREQRSNQLKTFEVDRVKGDFTNAFRSSRLLSVIPLQTWVLIVPQRDAGGVDNLLQTMRRVSGPVGFEISQPTEIVRLQNAFPEAYINAINTALSKYQSQLQMIFTILPNNKLDLYAAIKRRCYVDFGMPSQCFLAKNVGNKGLMSIATKLTVQMSCKLGGEAWQITIPLPKFMVVGFDVHHAGAGSKGASFGAMVATMSSTLGKYFSTLMEAQSREEITSSMAGELGKCVAAFKKVNGSYPDRIFFYRDGVGEGQLQKVYTEELGSIKQMLQGMYKDQGLSMPKFAYIVVTKRINTRFFAANQRLENPLPGTIVDTVVTFPERYDFYLIAQAVRQGTVSPTSYNVLFDRSALDADKIQRITYKLCNIYFNFSGTVAVPAPCQYAHKLAFMAGTAMRTTNHEQLSHQLYFL